MSAGWPAQINSQCLLPTSASMPAVLVAGPTATQNSQFLLLITPTWPTNRGMARLSGPEWPEKYRDGRQAKGRHQSQY